VRRSLTPLPDPHELQRQQRIRPVPARPPARFAGTARAAATSVNRPIVIGRNVRRLAGLNGGYPARRGCQSSIGRITKVKPQLVQIGHRREIKPRCGDPELSKLLLEHEQRQKTLLRPHLPHRPRPKIDPRNRDPDGLDRLA
jgi:hypothetical protein